MPLREAFLRIFPLLLILNLSDVLAAWLDTNQHPANAQHLRLVSEFISNTYGFAFLLLASVSASVSYTLNRFSLYTCTLISSMALMVQTGEFIPLNIAQALLIFAASIAVACNVEKLLQHQPQDRQLLKAAVRGSTGFCLAIALAAVVILPLFGWLSTLGGQIAAALQTYAAAEGASPLKVDALYLLAVVARSTLTFMGFHGHNTLLDLFNTLFELDKQLYSVDMMFAAVGGTGGTFSYILAAVYLTIRKRRQLNTLELQGAPFSLLNINELLVYGLPMVLNPYFLMPFIMVPLVGAGIGLAAAQIGLIDSPQNLQSWMTPVALQLSHVSSQPITLGVFVMFTLLCGSKLYMHSLTRSTAWIENSTSLRDRLGKDTMLNSRSADTVQKSLEIAEAQVTVSRFFNPECICFVYQPIVDAGGKVLAIEVLLRIRDGKQLRGPLEILEATVLLGLEQKLDEYVLKNAPKTLTEIARLAPKLQVAINVTPTFAHQDNFVSLVEETADAFALPLVIEITEQSPIEDMSELCTKLEFLQQRGDLLIAIDDFGSRYSSLDYLQTIHGDKLKLDASLLRQLATPRGSEVVRSTVELGKKLGFQIVAEGIETEKDFLRLRALGVDCFQGFFFSKPLELHDLHIYLLKQQRDNTFPIIKKTG